MTPVAERYFEELDALLRERSVPAATATALVADFRARIVASGAHPYTEFGDPEALADRLASGAGRGPAPVADRLATGAFAAAAVALTVDGGIGIARDHARTFGIEPSFVVAIGIAFALLALWPLAGTGRRPRYAGPWWTASAIVAVGMAITAAIQAISRLA